MDSHNSLIEGLELFQKKNERFFATKSYSEKGQEFLKCHDIAHVVFGCNTTIYGEGVVKIWTTFGTNLSFWEVMKGYRSVKAHELAQDYSFGHVAKNIVKLLITIPKVIYRAKKMKKDWPFMDHDQYLSKSIAEIREEFGIRVI